MERVGDEHPPFVSVTFLNLFDQLGIIVKGTRDGHSLHVPRSESIDKSFLFIDRISEAAGDKIGQAYSEGVALCLLGQAKRRDDFDFRKGEVLEAVNSSSSDDIGIHSCPAIGFSDFVHDEHVEFVCGEGREVVAVSLEKGGLLLEDIFSGKGVDFGGGVKAILQNSEPSEDLARFDQKRAHLI